MTSIANAPSTYTSGVMYPSSVTNKIPPQQGGGGYSSIVSQRMGRGLGGFGSMQGGYGAGGGMPFNISGYGGMNAGLGSFGGFNPMMGGYGGFGGFNPMMGMGFGGFGGYGGFNPMMGMGFGGFGGYGGFNPMMGMGLGGFGGYGGMDGFNPIRGGAYGGLFDGGLSPDGPHAGYDLHGRPLGSPQPNPSTGVMPSEPLPDLNAGRVKNPYYSDRFANGAIGTMDVKFSDQEYVTPEELARYRTSINANDVDTSGNKSQQPPSGSGASDDKMKFYPQVIVPAVKDGVEGYYSNPGSSTFVPRQSPFRGFGGFQGMDPRAQAQMYLMNNPHDFGMFSTQRPVFGGGPLFFEDFSGPTPVWMRG